MTDIQRRLIEKLRGEGYGYTAVADKVGMPKETVKSYCRYHNLNGKRAKGSETRISKKCLFCGNDLTMTPHKRLKKYCSDTCRMAWWNSHPEKVNRKKMYEHICLLCGNTFMSKNSNQKFCCRSCYSISRRKEHENEK